MSPSINLSMACTPNPVSEKSKFIKFIVSNVVPSVPAYTEHSSVGTMIDSSAEKLEEGICFVDSILLLGALDSTNLCVSEKQNLEDNNLRNYKLSPMEKITFCIAAELSPRLKQNNCDLNKFEAIDTKMARPIVSIMQYNDTECLIVEKFTCMSFVSKLLQAELSRARVRERLK